MGLESTDSGARLLALIQALSLTSCVTLGKLLNLAEPQFPHLYNFSNNALKGSIGVWAPKSDCLDSNLSSKS